MTDNVHDLRPKVPDSEKITVNLGFVDLGRVDLMVRDGFYANRADFIRTAYSRPRCDRRGIFRTTHLCRLQTAGNPRPEREAGHCNAYKAAIWSSYPAEPKHAGSKRGASGERTIQADVRRIARALYSASASGEAEFHVGRETVSF